MWAQGGLFDDQGPLEAMRQSGASPEQLAAYRARLDSEAAEQRHLSILPENWHAWKVFCGMGTQWRISGGFNFRRHDGLDYTALPIVLAENRSVQPRQPLDVLMLQLRTLEAAALEILNQD